VADPAWDPPPWAWPVTVATAGIGLAVSGYLTAVHYTTTVTLACSATGTINCEKVTSSPQSELAGVPVAVWGVGYFAVAIALCLPGAWASRSRWVRYARVATVVTGILTVLRLIYAELFQIDAICLWCTAVHVATFAMFGAVVVANALATTPRSHG